MLKEVLSRRFKRAILEKGNYLTLPDLILIDGGKGQYSSAKEVLNKFADKLNIKFEHINVQSHRVTGKT